MLYGLYIILALTVLCIISLVSGFIDMKKLTEHSSHVPSKQLSHAMRSMAFAIGILLAGAVILLVLVWVVYSFQNYYAMTL